MSMTNAAQLQDVIDRWRPVEDGNEPRVIETKLKDIHRRIRKRFTDLERDLDAELEAAALTGATVAQADFLADVIEVEAEAVRRVMLNPEGWKAESIDDWTGDRGSRSNIDGSLFLTREEWAQIGVTGPSDEDQGKAFVIDQTPAYAGYGMYPPRWGWDV